MAGLMGGGAGAGAGAGGGGDMAGAAGMGSQMDWTFGQGKVWDEKTKRQMQLLTSLIGARNAGAPVNSGQTMSPTQIHPAIPFILSQLLGFGGR